MKKLLVLGLGLLLVLLLSISCERVAPNYYGVLMENYGKNGKDDYVKQQGRVITISPGTELFQVPAWEQRGQFTDDEGKDRTLQVKAADNTAFTSKPLYSYKVIEAKVVDVVFQNSRLGSGNDFMLALQDNVLEPRIYDIIKEASRSYTTDQLMANGGSLKFEQYVQEVVSKEFEKSGLGSETLNKLQEAYLKKQESMPKPGDDDANIQKIVDHEKGLLEQTGKRLLGKKMFGVEFTQEKLDSIINDYIIMKR
jgi:hypothetical protein